MRWIVGFLLLGAAVLKAVQLWTDPTATLVSPLGRWFLPMQVGAEMGLGLLVLNGLYWRQVRWIVLALFAAFAAYSLHLAVGGATSCGCFGPIKIHPWWTFLLDMAILVGLFFSVLHSSHVSNQSGMWRVPSWSANRPAAVAVIVSLSVLGTAALVRFAADRTAAANDLHSTAGDFVVLEPERWIGEKFPVAEFIDLDLSQGEWIVLLHRHDCPDCQEQVPVYEELAVREAVALIEVPPYGESPAVATGAAYHCRLSNDREWFVQTPVEIQLQDGVVVAVKNGHGD